ncbi:hypothetical protein SA3R_21710 [Pantoea dispersa]|uniref:Uncharacterized protein n=1 Tax=Pantoea dispersa TaxID=59814 RepID=A0A8E1V6Y9_9GAMM|nr:hypothetical protein SA3R_21710 [Pantoea dispersa]
MEDQATSRKIAQGPRKRVEKAVKTAAGISEMIRSVLPKQVKRGDAAARKNSASVTVSPAAGYARRLQ